MSSPIIRDPFALVGTTLDGRFVIDRVVARGGFGVVYQGWHSRLLRPVALKVLVIPSHYAHEMQESTLANFEQEARLLAHLDHPAIVRVYDSGTSTAPDRTVFYWTALEWLHGETLEAILQHRSGSPMNPLEALTILRPVLQGLAFIHSLGIAHRDVKPANIFVSEASPARHGAAGTRLIDLGTARFVGEEDPVDAHSELVFPAFTVLYAAPEQVNGLKTGPWTDVHAAALILTEMLTGSRAYQGRTRREVGLCAIDPERPTPGHMGVDVGAWEAVLERALASRTGERYAHAGEFLAALESTLTDARSVVLGRGGLDDITDTVEKPSGVVVAWSASVGERSASPQNSDAPRRRFSPILSLLSACLIVFNLLLGAVLGVPSLKRFASGGGLAANLHALSHARSPSRASHVRHLR